MFNQFERSFTQLISGSDGNSKQKKPMGLATTNQELSNKTLLDRNYSNISYKTGEMPQNLTV